MKLQSLGTVLLLLAQAMLGAWAVLTLLEPDYLLTFLSQLAWC